MKIAFGLLILLASMAGCKVLQQAAEGNLKTGYYTVKNEKISAHNVYVVQKDDSVRVYTLAQKAGELKADSIHFKTYSYPDESLSFKPKTTFIRKGFDMDIVSILFKYRPSIQYFAPQLNTNFNAAAYLGYRWDDYTISYNRTPLKSFKKTSHHFAYGAGFFGGIGSTAMNEYVTTPAIDKQYEGVVIAKGIMGIVAVGHLSFGVAVGADDLLGKDKGNWIYNNKLWTGITVGLNLN